MARRRLPPLKRWRKNMSRIGISFLAIVAIQFSAIGQDSSTKFADGEQKLILAISEGFFPKPRHFVWDDGVFLIWPYPEKDPDFAFIGKYEQQDLKEALEEIENTNFHKMERLHYGIPDAPWTEIYAVTKSRTLRVSWWEYLHPGFGADVTSDHDYREFVKNWKKVRAAETRLTPVEIYLLMNRKEFSGKRIFRGVNLDDPEKSNLPELEVPN